MNKWKTALAAASISTALHSPAEAAGYACNMQPNIEYGIGGDGDVVIAYDATRIIKICNIVNATGDVTPQSCLAWYSSILTAKIANQQIRLFFDSNQASNAGTTACTDFSTTNWSTHIPYFLDFI